MSQSSIEQRFAIAIEHHQSGRLQQAEILYKEILAKQPNHAGALHYLGLMAHQAGRNDIAVDLIRRAVTFQPDYAEAHCNLGVALKANGQLDHAIAAYRQAIVLKPVYPEAHNNLGNALKEKGQLDDAIVACREAIAQRPDYAEAHCNLGNALVNKGQLEEAIAEYRQAISLRLNYPAAYNNLGNALKENGQIDEAIVSYRRAIAIRPDYAEAYSNLGNALSAKEQLDGAIAAFRQAIALRADYAEAYSNLGNALKDEGRLDEAIAAYRQAVSLDRDDARLDSNVVYSLYFHSGYDGPLIAKELRRWNLQHAQPLRKLILPHTNDPSPDRRLRIGYVSPDFRDHVVGQNLLPLFRRHDHEQFEITCYAQVLRPDAVTSLFQEIADCWRNIVGLSDDAVARQIRQDQIDILVDLTLHMGNNRLLIFARKPAPVQVTYLGYCGSTGLSAMDYRLSDPHFDPPDSDLSCYSEKTLRLPRTYWCYQPGQTPMPSPSPALSNGWVTFGCLNNFAKVSPAALDLWARILSALPDSRMIIHAPPGKHLEEVTQRFERAGVANHRLIFVGKQPWNEYIQTYSRIDIALDPFPYGGGITTCDALWMGVPVVSFSGQTAVGRGGRSILCNLSLAELVAFTQDQYVQIAIDLAKDLDRLDTLRRGMRSRMLSSPLADAKGFAREVEAAYRLMWRTWCQAASVKATEGGRAV